MCSLPMRPRRADPFGIVLKPSTLRSQSSADRLDPDGVSRACGEWAVAGDQWSVESRCEGDVHGVVYADVVSQLPRSI